MPVDINEIAQKVIWKITYSLTCEALRHSQSTFPLAVNLPFENLLDKQSLKMLDTKKTKFLFADKGIHQRICGLLLQSQGFENLRIAANDFDFLKNQVWEFNTVLLRLSASRKSTL